MPTLIVNPLEIYKILEKSNCGECQEKTCFAFASLVSRGEKSISACPHVPADVKNEIENKIEPKKSIEEEQVNEFKELEKQVSHIDISTLSTNLGAVIHNNTLIIKCLGKNFIIDQNGHISSEIHVHYWIKKPLLHYVLKNSPDGPIGNWVQFRQLPNGEKWNPLYMQRCEKPLLKIADKNSKLFCHIITLFGKEVAIDGIHADSTTKLHPFPNTPILICYSKPEDGFESQLSFYYDQNIEDILNIESIYLLATGLSIMLEKIMKRHL